MEVIYHFNRTDMSELTKIIFTINIVVLFIQLGYPLYIIGMKKLKKIRGLKKLQ